MTAAPQGANSASTQYDLGEIVRQLSNLRTNSQKSRYRDATPAMPSRVALQDIADGLVAALFRVILGRRAWRRMASTILSPKR